MYKQPYPMISYPDPDTYQDLVSGTLMEQVYTFLDGRYISNEGMIGQLSYSISYAKYPYKHVVHRLEWTCVQTEHPEYLRIKEKLGDNWSSDWTHADDLISIAQSMGFTFHAEQTTAQRDYPNGVMES